VKILGLKVRLTEINFLIVRLITIKIFNRCPALMMMMMMTITYTKNTKTRHAIIKWKS